MGWADHTIILFLLFLRNFHNEVVPIYFPSNGAQEFQFLHILIDVCCLLSFDDSHSNRCVMMSHCDFDLHFSDD